MLEDEITNRVGRLVTIDRQHLSAGRSRDSTLDAQRCGSQPCWSDKGPQRPRPEPTTRKVVNPRQAANSSWDWVETLDVGQRVPDASDDHRAVSASARAPHCAHGRRVAATTDKRRLSLRVLPGRG